MAQGSCKVVFDGKLVAGTEKARALEGLVELFKSDTATIKRIFKGRGSVIKTGLTREDALKLISDIRAVGVICVIEGCAAAAGPQAVASGHAEKAHAQQEPVGQTVERKPHESVVSLDDSGYFEPAVFVLKPMRADVTLSPLKCNRLSGSSGGIATGRNDLGEAGFGSIRAVSVYSGEALSMLLLTSVSRRPLLVECDHITFSDFPGVGAHSIQESVRRFVLYLYGANSGIAVDEGTYRFVQGAAPAAFGGDPTVMARALLDAMGYKEPPALEPQPAAAPEELSTAEVNHYLDEYKASLKDVPAEDKKEKGGWTAYPLILLIGALIPLYRPSPLAGRSIFIWPWQFMGLGVRPEVASALGQEPSGGLLAWALVPLLAGFAGLYAGRKLSGASRAITMLLAGVAGLFAMLGVLFREGEVFGVLVLPTRLEAGMLSLLVVLSAAAVAAAGSVRKRKRLALLPRLLQGSGAVLVFVGLLATFGGAWSGWAMRAFYIMVAAYGAMGLAASFTQAPDRDFLKACGFVARLLVLWAPIAVVITQSSLEGAYLRHVLGAQAGVITIAASAAKCFLIYYGMALMATLGLRWLLDR